MSGCLVDAVKPTKVGESEYYPFLVSHPKSTKCYNLAATSVKEAESWVNAIKIAASKTASASGSFLMLLSLCLTQPNPI